MARISTVRGVVPESRVADAFFPYRRLAGRFDVAREGERGLLGGFAFRFVEAYHVFVGRFGFFQCLDEDFVVVGTEEGEGFA